MQVVIFASASEQGQELPHKIKKEVFTSFPGFENINCEIFFPGDEKFDDNYFSYCQLVSDLVIFDASVEEDSNQALGDNYACAAHAPYLNDNTLVVSRTELPLNYIPNHTNVLPTGEDYSFNKGVLSKISFYSNNEIIEWIKEQVVLREEKGLLPRPSDYKASFEFKYPKSPFEAREIGVRLSNELDRQKQLVGDSFQKPYEHTAFISYRSHYYNNKCCGYDVFELERLILDYHHKTNPDEQWKVLFYPPGSLSQDCPTENLRWSLKEYVEDKFKDVAEVWIFETWQDDEKSYWDSWFTQGEYLALMEINQSLHDYMPKVFMFNPHTGEYKQIDSFPRISDENSHELSSIGANTDNRYGDRAGLINTIDFYSNWRKKNFFHRMLMRYASKRLYGINVDDYRSMHAYKPEFLTGRVLQCPHCSQGIHYRMEDFNDDEFIRNFIRIGDTSAEYREQNEKRGVFVASHDKFMKAVAEGYIECPNCHKKIYIKHSPEQTKYLWTRKLHRTATQNINYIERIDAYNIL